MKHLLNVLKNVLHFKQLFNETLHCPICHLAKQKRLPFPISNSVSISAFELLHLDIWGAFCGPAFLMMSSHSISETRFLFIWVKNMIFTKDLESPLTFIYF